MASLAQDKKKEIAFFDGHAVDASYDVFAAESSERLVETIMELGQFRSGVRVADLGCGSGVFTKLLHEKGCEAVGIDISSKLVAIGRHSFPGVEFLAGDVEALPFANASFDGVLLSGIVHHLPDPGRCAAEVFRVLRPGGRFVTFDPTV